MSILNHRHFHDEEAAFAKLESIVWPNGPVCPHCGATDRIFALNGVRTKASKKNPEGIVRYGLKKCGHCRQQFTARVGTVFESSHIPLHKWLQAAHLLCSSKKGISSHQLHRVLQITYKAAWFMSHRLREAMREGSLAPPMGGAGQVVEIDETVYGLRADVQRDPNADGRAYGLWPNRNVVFSLVQRGGRVRTFHVGDVNAATLIPIIYDNVAAETALMTDSASWYRRLNRSGEYASHDQINHTEEEYARYESGRPVIHTNTVEGYFALFKRGMRGTYQHCSEKHLHRYLAEFDFRYNARSALGVEDEARTEKALRGIRGKRLTYRAADRA